MQSPERLGSIFKKTIHLKQLIIPLLTVCLPTIIFGQKTLDTTDTWGWVSHYYGYEINYGQYSPSIVDLNDKLKMNYGFSFSPLNTIGLNLCGAVAYNRFIIADANMTFNYFMPTTKNYGDSLSLTLRGYQFGLSPFGQDLLHKSKHFDLIIGTGFYAGRLRIDSKAKNDNTYKYTNPFFSPKVHVEFRAIIGKISLGIRAEYIVDTGKGRWRRKDSSLQALQVSKTTGTMYQVFIGFGSLR